MFGHIRRDGKVVVSGFEGWLRKESRLKFTSEDDQQILTRFGQIGNWEVYNETPGILDALGAEIKTPLSISVSIGVNAFKRKPERFYHMLFDRRKESHDIRVLIACEEPTYIYRCMRKLADRVKGLSNKPMHEADANVFNNALREHYIKHFGAKTYSGCRTIIGDEDAISRIEIT